MDAQLMEQTISAEERTKEMIAERLDRLPLSQLQQVLTFTDFILYQHPQPSAVSSADTANTERMPAPDAFVHLAGGWKFEPGELEEIMQDIEQGRLMELEEADVLFD